MFSDRVRAAVSCGLDGQRTLELRANESYRFVGALIDEFDTDIQLVLDGQSEIRPLV
ncbi:hypothetical protein [Halococcus saccharolyticus]|uniref:hypothetical protein n=1 Tax=Halococcus saccharolyticus TaxID=62319 RepID=UPI000AC57241|nr:hypothetical protein [Halococcus saccharolyticus]